MGKLNHHKGGAEMKIYFKLVIRNDDDYTGDDGDTPVPNDPF